MNKKIIFVLSLILVLIVIAFVLYRGSMFSKEILRLEIMGPDNAKIGEEIEYTVQYKNSGNFVLEKAKLIFILPENSLTEDGKTMLIKNLNDIYPGNQDSVKFKARLLGNEGELKTAKASLSYVPKNITAQYESKTTFITKIDASPITLEFDLPTKAEQGKNLSYSINYFSNVDYPLENLSIKIEPISGFEVISSSPSSLDNLEWKLPVLNKAQGGRINITGKVSADDNQSINFSANIGMWQNGRFITIKKNDVKVQTIDPLLSISQQVNGSSSYVASPGETLNYKIFFRNIGSTPFNNLFMVVKLSSPLLDMNSIQIEKGGQLQANNTIIWDYTQVQQLKDLGIQQQGEVGFSIKVKNDGGSSGANVQNIVIANEVTISQITQKFEIKLSSGLFIMQKGYYQNEEISNSGQIPPKVGQSTTYTINWEIKNYFSNAKNVKVKAVLPSNVNLTGKIMPEDESSNFSFDSVSREIVWSVGDVMAGTGVTGDPITLSFQVSLVPNISQRGTIAPIIGSAQISGENQFTNTLITSQSASVDTLLPDDYINSGGGIIQ